jgi:hypothetical protein
VFPHFRIYATAPHLSVIPTLGIAIIRRPFKETGRQLELYGVCNNTNLQASERAVASWVAGKAGFAAATMRSAHSVPGGLMWDFLCLSRLLHRMDGGPWAADALAIKVFAF